MSTSKPNKKRFRPRKTEIRPDEPTNQPDPTIPGRSQTAEDIIDLQPKFLGRGATQPKNDTSDAAEMLSGVLMGLVFKPKKYSFYTNASGYLDLIDATWIDIQSTDRYFERNCSKAMYVYYCIILYWKSLLCIDLFDTAPN